MRNATLIDQLLVGLVRPLPRHGHAPVPSGIVKQARNGLLTLSFNGLDGDEQGDPVFHGGPEKALHHYPGEHHGLWRALHPASPLPPAPGAFGENLSTIGMTEDGVHIGDVYQAGTALPQVSPNWRTTFSRRVASRLIEDWTRRLHEPS